MAKGINIFDSAKGKPKPSSSAKDKPTVEVDGIEAQLNELQNLKTQIANLETELDVVTDEIKTIAKEKFVELYLENGRNPNTFLLKDGSGCVMVIPTDKYISIKDEDRANQLIETYGEDIVTIDEKYYFNPEVLERNMKAIEKLIRDAKSISDADKQNLLIREVKYSVTKGTIDELYDYGEDMEAVINDIQPIITLKNCGGKMAEGGTDGEFIANVYGDYDAEVGSTVTSMYAKGGKFTQKLIDEVRENGEFMDSYMIDESQTVSNAGEEESYMYKGKNYLITTWNERAEKHKDGEETIEVVDFEMAKGGMMAKGGKISDMTYIGTLYDADDAMNAKKDLLKTGNFTDIKIQKVKQAYQLNKYSRGNENYYMWRIYVDLSDDVDSPSKYEKLSKKWKSIIQKNETYKGRHKVYAYGGMMAKGGEMSRKGNYTGKIITTESGDVMIGNISGYRGNGEPVYDVHNFSELRKTMLDKKGELANSKIKELIKKMAYGGMMAYAYGLKDYRIVGFYSDGFEEDLGNSNDLSEAIEMANAEQMQFPEYVTVKVLEVFGQKNSDYGDYEVIEYYSTNDKKALGGFFGGSSYNRSWHQDHYRHNKKESYEIPMNKRSRRFKRK